MHLLNNLGYVRLLDRDFEGAADALRRAHRLDPKNARVRSNWVALTQALPAGAQIAELGMAQELEPVVAPRQPATGGLVATPTAVATSIPEVAPPRAVSQASPPVINLSYEARSGSSEPVRAPVANSSGNVVVAVPAPTASSPQTAAPVALAASAVGHCDVRRAGWL